jgi:predicted phage terminase large subunit-like protein
MTTAAEVLKSEVSVEDVDRELAGRAKDELAEFVREAWDILEPETELSWNWHLDELCDVLERVTAGELTRVIINVPPGTMKSLLVSVFWPAWEWASNPGLRYFAASYGEELAVRDNERLRDLVTSSWYRRHYGLELKRSANQKVRFNTTGGGWRIGTSVGGRGTGEHPDRVIIDDPLTAEQARSSKFRDRAIQWFKRTVSTRGKARGVRIVLIMQRLHEDDLAGHLMDSNTGWELVSFPMRYVKAPKPPAPRPDPRDHRTTEGELLWPELFGEETVAELEIDLGPFGAAGQLQQAPAPEGGGLFRREWFDIVDAPPERADRCRGWDAAGTDNAGDYTAGVLIGYDRGLGLFYIEDVLREQMDPLSVELVIKQTAEMDGRPVSIVEEQEPGSSGKSVIKGRARDLAGYDYAGVPSSGDKVTRARAFRAQCQARNVLLVRAPWNRAYLDELAVFPAGAHDDQVDASSAAFNELTTGARPLDERDIEMG